MAGYKEKLILDYSLETVLLALGNTVAEMKWKVVSQDRSKIVLREPVQLGGTLAIPTQIEIRTQPLSHAIGVEVQGAQPGFGAAQTAHVQQQVSDVVASIYHHLDKIGTPEQQLERQYEAQQRAAEQREAAAQAAQQLEAERKAADERAEAYRVARQMATEEREAARRAAAEQATSPAPEPFPSALPPAASSAGVSLSAELERLAKLHEQGILTDDEFRQAKQRLLGL